MKKKIIFAGATLLLATAAVTMYSTSNKSSISDLLNANVEALARGESGEYAICYYESKVAIGYSYIFCPDCPQKTMDEKGRGSYTKCFY